MERDQEHQELSAATASNRGTMWWAATLWTISMLIYAVLNFWPASYWLEVRSVHVGPAVSGQPIAMDVDRTIHRRFSARWYVTVREWTPLGWVAVCNESREQPYAPGAVMPPDLGLSWWTYGRCDFLRPGRYVVDTEWYLRTWPWMPEKVVSVTSNIFEVAAAGGK